MTVRAAREGTLGLLVGRGASARSGSRVLSLAGRTRSQEPAPRPPWGAGSAFPLRPAALSEDENHLVRVAASDASAPAVDLRGEVAARTGNRSNMKHPRGGSRRVRDNGPQEVTSCFTRYC